MTPRDRITRYLSLIVLLFLVCACSSDDDQDPGIIAPESLAFTSGLADGGITPEAPQTFTGTIPNPSNSAIHFKGTVVIHLNDETIKAESVTRVDGAWRFSRPLTLQPGNNTLRLVVRNPDGDLFAAAAPWTFTAALPGDSPLTVSVVDAPGLDDYAHEDDFPAVHLTVDVRDADNSAVNGLTAAAFTIIDAGLAVPPDDFTDHGDGTYRLTYTDITCGRRNLRLYVTTGDQAGVSAPHTYGTNHALLAGINRYPSEIIKTVDAPQWSALNTTEVLTKLPADQPGFNKSRFHAELSATGSAPFIACEILDVDITDDDDEQITCRLKIQRPDNAPDQPLIIRYLPIPWLDYCLNDVTDIGDALQAPADAWHAADITTLTDDQASEQAITVHMNRIAHDMKPWDLFFFHYSGHGTTDRYDPQNTASQCLCTFEADDDGSPDPTNLGISVTELGETLSAFKAPGNLPNVIISLDSCFSGNFVQIPLDAEGAEHAAFATTRTLPSPSAAPENRTLDFSALGRQVNTFSARARDLTDANIIILTAASTRERSWDAGRLQNGVYSYHLARALTAAPLGTAPANTDHNPWISNEELFEEVRTTTLDWATANLRTTQTPQFKDNDPATPSRMLSTD